jgi:hypothetical protein
MLIFLLFIFISLLTLLILLVVATRWRLVGDSLAILLAIGWLYASQLFNVSIEYSLVELMAISQVEINLSNAVLTCDSVSPVSFDKDFGTFD